MQHHYTNHNIGTTLKEALADRLVTFLYGLLVTV